jgi:hypothetical protein
MEYELNLMCYELFKIPKSIIILNILSSIKAIIFLNHIFGIFKNVL